MNRLKSFLATLTLLLCNLSASAQDFEVDGIYYNITSNTDMTVEVTDRRTTRLYSYDSNEYTGSAVIPETVTYNSKTYSVTSIGHSAFQDCSGLTSVHISDIAAWCNIEFSGSESSPLYYAKRNRHAPAVTDFVIIPSTAFLRKNLHICTGVVMC